MPTPESNWLPSPPIEARGVAVTGFIVRVDRRVDGDLHIQITAAPVGRCLHVTAPDQLITELTPQFQARRPAYTLAKLRALCGTQTPVRLSGWLLHDSSHDEARGRSTPWEVHPVTRIEVCCWRELS